MAGPSATAPVIGTHPDPDGKHRLPDTGLHVATPPPPGGSSASPAPSSSTTTPPGTPSQPAPTPTITDPSSPTPYAVIGAHADTYGRAKPYAHVIVV